MITLVKTTQESQIKGELYKNKWQESVNFISAKFDNTRKTKHKRSKNKKF